MRLIKISFLFGILLSLALVTASLGFAATSTINTSIVPGVLQVIAPAGGTPLSNLSVTEQSQISTGTISNLRIDDNRGNGAGWSVAATSQHFTFTETPSSLSTNTSPSIAISSGSRYDGTCGVVTPPVSYTITVVQAGAVGVALYTVTGGCSSENNQTAVVTAVSNNAVGSRGIFIDFPPGTYAMNDSWNIPVDVFPYTGFTITPRDPTEAVTGSGLDGLTKGTSGVFTGSNAISDSRAILEAAPNKGLGSYYQNIDLSLNIHGRSFAGNYGGIITFTIL